MQSAVRVIIRLSFGLTCASINSIAFAEPVKAHNEFTPAPIVGGSSDVGIGGAFARRVPGYEPYLYRLELATTTTFKGVPGTVQVPYQDYYLVLTMPHVRKNHTGLEIRVSYTRESNLNKGESI